MKASKNSFHVWLYQFTYMASFPLNLCPYFWKLVWAVVIFVPNFLLQLPMIVANIFVKDYAHGCGERREDSTVFYIGAIVLAIYMTFTYHWVMAMLNAYSYNSVLANIGWIMNAGFLAGVVISGVMKLNWKKKRFADKKTNIIIEFAKAKYYKYCPEIEWED